MWYNAPFNAEIIKYIQSFANPTLDKLFVFITIMGEETFFMIVELVIFWCVDKEFGYRMGFTFISNSVVNGVVKNIFKVPRPIGEPGIRSLRTETAGGYSFPSGHTQGAASLWTSITIKVKKAWMYVLGMAIVVLIAISRLYLGVHRPVDVIFGFAIGAAWVFVINYMFDICERTGRKSVFLIVIVPMAVLLFVFHDADYFKAAGVTLAFYAGYIIEPKYIKYDVKAKFIYQILKLIFGIAVLACIRAVLKAALPKDVISDFIRYFLMGIWVIIGAPYVFTKFKKYME